MTASTFVNARLGVIGTRQLILVQTLDIARLTAHPVRLIPETFIAVTGMGPVDSNESGKTSFLAAVALLLGDPEWRVTGSGAGAVASLLFEPVTAGVTGASAATQGYVVGVFADRANIAGSACSVWMRISSGSPYIQVRHASGIHLAGGTDDRERHSNAPRVFRNLTGETWGGAEFAEKLYGRSPRVLAYVASRGQVRSRPSLLKLDAGTFTPDQIGDALVSLSGRATLFERDEQDRKGLANKRAELQTHIENDRKQSVREAEILRRVDAREELRRQTSSALHMWNSGLARAVVDTYICAESASSLHIKSIKAREGLEFELTSATSKRDGLSNLRALQDELKECNSRLNDAREINRRAVSRDGQFVGELNTLIGLLSTARQNAAGYDLKFELSASAAVEQREHRIQEIGVSKGKLQMAEDALTAAVRARREAADGQFGEPGQVIRLLANEGVTAKSLVAAVRLDPNYRDVWEARLAPWRDALVVARADLEKALPLLGGHAGTVIISEPGIDRLADSAYRLPVGVAAAPAEAIAFLDSLAQQRHLDAPVIHAYADQIGIRIVGGFSAPVVGLDDLIFYWEQQVVAAKMTRQQCSAGLLQAERLAELATINASRAQSAEEAVSLSLKRDTLQERLRVHRQDVMPPLSKAVDDAEEQRSAADRALAQRTRLLNEANADVLRLQSELRAIGTEIDRYKAASQPDDSVLAEWGRGKEAALRQLGWLALPVEEDYEELIETAEPPPIGNEEAQVERRPRVVLQQGAHDKLVEAIAGLRVYPDTGATLPSDVIQAASSYVASREKIGSAPVAEFASVLSALTEWLEDSADRDASAYEEVDQARRARNNTTEFVEGKCRDLERDLLITQDAIRQRAASALDRIGVALLQLNRRSGGFGAGLDYRIVAPDGPDQQWVCQVIPRWRRNPEGPMLAYDNVTNTAQEKLFSIHLVLAALLAAPSPEGRVLILDELADSLGAEHRRDVLDAIAEVAKEHGITILATCQDAIMSEASPHCGEILYFHYPSKSEALNRPTRMFGVDRVGNRVELTAESLLQGREF